ncbi:MAG: hypothetical protein KC478_02490 [Bacteriovoracaceae bacterium]|nr:hypothetical protein [Bacteriovoracaceae bacterium]
MTLMISVALLILISVLNKRNGVSFIVFSALFPLLSYLEIKFLFNEEIGLNYFLLSSASLIMAISAAIDVFHFKKQDLPFFIPGIVFIGLNSIYHNEFNIFAGLVLIILHSYFESSRRKEALDDGLWLKVIGICIVEALVLEGYYETVFGQITCLVITSILIIILLLRFKEVTVLAALSLLLYLANIFSNLENYFWIPWIILTSILLITINNKIKIQLFNLLKSNAVASRLIDLIKVKNILKTLPALKEIELTGQNQSIKIQAKSFERNDNVIAVELVIVLVIAVVMFISMGWLF